MSTYLQHHYRSPFPALNIHRRKEAVATDTIYSDTPAIASGATQAQFFCGQQSLVCDVFEMKTDKQFVNTLEDTIRQRGAMDKLITDSAQVEITGRVKDILRAYVIGNWSSEPAQQQQNPAERKYQHVKRTTNRTMERTGSPANTWLLAIMYVCHLLNHTASENLKWRVPLERLTGFTPDISPLLRFQWYEPVYYKLNSTHFPSDTREKKGRFVGIAENVGHSMTYKILTDDTGKIICRSNIRSALDPSAPNLRLDLSNGEYKDKTHTSSKEKVSIPNLDHDTYMKIIKSANDLRKDKTMMFIAPEDMIGRSFLSNPTDNVTIDNGERHRAFIVREIEDHDNKMAKDPARIKFLCSFNNNQYQEILAYNNIIRHI